MKKILILLLLLVSCAPEVRYAGLLKEVNYVPTSLTRSGKLSIMITDSAEIFVSGNPMLRTNDSVFIIDNKYAKSKSFIPKYEIFKVIYE